MSVASDLIERLEKETGQRLDVSDSGNLVVAGLFGAISRIMGQSPPSYRERDDVVAGLFIRHQMSPQGQSEQRAKEAMVEALAMGLPPGLFTSK